MMRAVRRVASGEPAICYLPAETQREAHIASQPHHLGRGVVGEGRSNCRRVRGRRRSASTLHLAAPINSNTETRAASTLPCKIPSSRTPMKAAIALSGC
jgi:hypothetical protein